MFSPAAASGVIIESHTACMGKMLPDFWFSAVEKKKYVEIGNGDAK